MKKGLSLLLALVMLCCAAAVAEYLPPREAALAILDLINGDFEGVEGFYPLDYCLLEDETRMAWYSEGNGVACTLEYDEMGMGVGIVSFMSMDVDGMYVSASYMNHLVTAFMGEQEGLVDWFGGAFSEILAEIEETGAESGVRVFPVPGGEIDALMQYDAETDEVTFMIILGLDYALMVG